TGDAIRAFVNALGFQPSWQVGNTASTIFEPVDYVLTHWKSTTVEAATLDAEPAPTGPYVPEPSAAPAASAAVAVKPPVASEPAPALKSALAAERSSALTPVRTRPQDVAVIGIVAATTEPAGLKKVSYAATTQQRKPGPGPKPVGPPSG